MRKKMLVKPFKKMRALRKDGPVGYVCHTAILLQALPKCELERPVGFQLCRANADGPHRSATLKWRVEITRHMAEIRNECVFRVFYEGRSFRASASEKKSTNNAFQAVWHHG